MLPHNKRILSFKPGLVEGLPVWGCNVANVPVPGTPHTPASSSVQTLAGKRLFCKTELAVGVNGC